MLVFYLHLFFKRTYREIDEHFKIKLRVDTRKWTQDNFGRMNVIVVPVARNIDVKPLTWRRSSAPPMT
jgi:hypothetical protein